MIDLRKSLLAETRTAELYIPINIKNAAIFKTVIVATPKGGYGPVICPYWKYADLLKYRTHTDGFNLNFANNGLFGIIQGGPTRVVADGYYVMTEPLAKVRQFNLSTTQDITYTIVAR